MQRVGLGRTATRTKSSQHSESYSRRAVTFTLRRSERRDWKSAEGQFSRLSVIRQTVKGARMCEGEEYSIIKSTRRR